jgi:hypothetical protein
VTWKGGGDISFTRSGLPSAGMTFGNGLIFEADMDRAIDLGVALSALTEAFRKLGVNAQGHIGSMPPNSGNDSIHVLVGKKPS